ncbi:MAG: RDD family protein [Armatimonadota bacterium]|nr:RDD family protein [Armatimonadota bacterium]
MRAYWDEDLSILSAENVNFAMETAGLGSRFAAIVIDMTLQLFIFFAISLVAVYGFDFLPTEGDVARWALSIGGAIFILITFLLWYGYFFFFEWLWDGQTPGKRWLGLRVVQVNSLPVTIWPAFVRNLLRIVDFLPIFYGVGSLVCILNPHNRRVGDLVAGTVVIRERRDVARRQVLDINTAVEAFLAAASSTGIPATPAAATSATPSSVTSAQPPVAASAPIDPEVAAILMRLDEEDYELAREFLRRRATLQPAARQRLAYSLATRLSLKLGQPMPAPEDIEPYIEVMARTLQQARHQ